LIDRPASASLQRLRYPGLRILYKRFRSLIRKIAWISALVMELLNVKSNSPEQRQIHWIRFSLSLRPPGTEIVIRSFRLHSRLLVDQSGQLVVFRGLKKCVVSVLAGQNKAALLVGHRS
jgi:hypothetical protein